MRIFELLKTEQRDKRLAEGEEYRFFMDNRHLLVDYNVFLDLYNLEDSFAMVKANIVLRALQNKKAIETMLEEAGKVTFSKHGRFHHHDVRGLMNERPYELPSFMEKDTNLYVPIFNRAMNYVYAREPDKLHDYPFDKLVKDFSSSIINPFETYNFSLFDSDFTTLIKLGRDRTSMAFYHLDYREILIINQQGGLDVKIALFDRYLTNPNYERIIERTLPVIKAFFGNDRDQLVAELLKQELISDYIVEKWEYALAKEERRKYRL